jgi:uncharacterized protein (TIGR03086 family)
MEPDAMDAKELFLRSLDQATAVVDRVSAEDFHNATPAIDWTLRDLVEHTLYELSWTKDIVAGKTLEQVGDIYDDDVIGGHLQTSWHEAADAARHAIVSVSLDDTAHLSYGDTTVEDYLMQAGSDQLIHAWDLATALGINVTFDEDLVEAVYEYMLTQQKLWQASGLFAAPVEVSQQAPLQTRLLALTGRAA